MKGFVEMFASERQRHVEHSEMERAESLPALSVVAPAYNEQESIEDFVMEMCQHLDVLPPPANTAGASYELICVDDGSTDQTFARLMALRQRFPQLRPLRSIATMASRQRWRPASRSRVARSSR